MTTEGSMTRFGARCAVVVAAAAMFAALSAGSAVAGVGQKCPGTFQVLHDDKIDNMAVPAGRYRITVKRLSCASASNYFEQFLAADENKLPKGWTLNRAKKKFKNRKLDVAFRIKRGGGGGGGGGSTGKCPGTFQVLHNDKIDSLPIPAGRYQIRVKRMPCQGASSYFTQFLSAPGNKLPKGWKLIKPKQKFKVKKGNYSFRIKKVG